MVALQRCGRRKWWKEKLCRSWRVIRPRPSSCSRTDTTSCPRPHAGAYPSSGSWTGTSRPRTSSPRARTLDSGPGSRCCRCHRLKKRFWIRHRCRLWRRNDGRRRRSYDCSSIGRRGAKLDVLKSLTRGSIPAAGAAASTSRGTGSAATDGGRTLEIVLRGGIKNENQNERMRKERGGGSFPPPLSLARYSYRRPIPSVYVDGDSFGDTPMTFTPAPRAASIAKITSEYLTFGSPFTKMIFSGRPS